MKCIKHVALFQIGKSLYQLKFKKIILEKAVF